MEVLKTRRVTGVDTLIVRHPQLGSYAVAREWTDWRVPDESTGAGARKLAAASLLELASLLAQLDERDYEALDE